MTDIGVCIAEEVLGTESLPRSGYPRRRGHCGFSYPGTDKDNQLAAALARLPWEIGRPALDRVNLTERNLVVRVIHDMAAPATQPLGLGAGEVAAGVVCLCRGARGSPAGGPPGTARPAQLCSARDLPPAAGCCRCARPRRNPPAVRGPDQERGGYHVIHWSGHGHLNLWNWPSRAAHRRNLRSGAAGAVYRGGRLYSAAGFP